MSAADVLSLALSQGVRLSLKGGRIVASPKGAISEELRRSIIENRVALHDALSASCSGSAATTHGQKPAVAGVADVAHLEGAMGEARAEARRQRVLAMLADRQAIRYAATTDAEADPEAVILTLAIRGLAAGGGTLTCELRIPRGKYDPAQLMHLIDRHSATVH